MPRRVPIVLRPVPRLAGLRERAGRLAEGLRPRPGLGAAVSARPIATRRPAGSSCTSRASPTSAATSTAGCMAPEIAATSCAGRPPAVPRRRPTAGSDLRLLVNALFLRRFDQEYLEEMKGIADGAAAAGAKFDGRAVDLLDIVAINAGRRDRLPRRRPRRHADRPGGRRVPGAAHPQAERRCRAEHCSAFAATGPATADGKIVFGHITMWDLFHVCHLQRLARRQAGQGPSRPDADVSPAAS